MKINDKILSLPPYISTSWSNISTVRFKENQLHVTLVDGSLVQIPGLPSETTDMIFRTHAEYIENLGNPKTSSVESLADNHPQSILQIGFGSLEGTTSTIMHHDASQADSPPIPSEVLQKINAITKILLPEDLLNLPPAEQDCNCFHCQLVRAINQTKHEEFDEIVIDSKELEFRQWDIHSSGENLFTVVSRLDKNEKYTVFLGEPIGCTCGQQGCEHIVAVLKS